GEPPPYLGVEKLVAGNLIYKLAQLFGAFHDFKPFRGDEPPEAHQCVNRWIHSGEVAIDDRNGHANDQWGRDRDVAHLRPFGAWSILKSLLRPGRCLRT